ncbi:MAG TPA: ARMT1-like domain-containing protein [Tepidisphaeraceae bacterium]|nr:ARMT1-like domain-containing protein [Tepidisphaeraceae bacterium]
MKTAMECFPCFVRQALDAIRQVSQDPSLHERLLRQVCQEAASMDLRTSPPAMGQWIHQQVRALAGIGDPYAAIKQRFNRQAMQLYPGLKTQVDRSPDPFAMAVRLAIAGNRIDFGINGGTTEQEVGRVLQQATDCPIAGSIDALRQAVQQARRILYLADNAGEIVFDRLLVEQLPRQKVTLAVRGRPIINDALREDAAAAGLGDLVEVIDNGCDAPGTILDECSPIFREHFAAADLIIAKGQGNYETLDELTSKRIFFLLMVKCPRISQSLGQPEGTFVVHGNLQLR